MGYLNNHLATVSTGAFAAVLTALWPWFMGFAPILNFIFIMAVTVSWFLTIMCWLSQKSADYMKVWEKERTSHSHTTAATVQVYDGNSAEGGSDDVGTTDAEINEAKVVLGAELERLRQTVKIQDSEIEHLKKEISNLETRVQIESLRAELANLKRLASD